MVREIRLANDRGIALVDDEDFELCRQFSWSLVHRRYATAWMVVDGQRKKESMHRFILSAGPGSEVDHVNGIGLDNRRDNIRFATTRQNRANTFISSRSTSGFKGVSIHSKTGLWRARISFFNTGITIGYFRESADAARAYDDRARLEFGEFARLNFPKANELPAITPMDPSEFTRRRAEQKTA